MKYMISRSLALQVTEIRLIILISKHILTAYWNSRAQESYQNDAFYRTKILDIHVFI
jgi:hypothetical protein